MRNKKTIIHSSTGWLTKRQEQILRTQIRKNSVVINSFIKKIDLLANHEKCPKDANTLLDLRKRFNISISENDTFRKVLNKHRQIVDKWRIMPTDVPDPITFLVDRIQTRRKTLLAQACMK